MSQNFNERPSGMGTDRVSTIGGWLRSQVAPDLDAVINASQSINGAAESFQNLAPAVETFLRTATATGIKVSVTADQCTRMLSSLREKFELIPAFRTIADKLLKLLSLIYDMIVICARKLWILIPTFAYRLLDLLEIGPQLAERAIQLILKIFTPNESNQEGEVERHSVFGPITFLTELVGMLFLSRKPTTNELKDVNERFRFMQNLQRDTRDFCDSILDLLRHLPDIAQAWLARVVPLKWWCAVFAPGQPYAQWIDEVQKLDTVLVKERINYDTNLQNQVLMLFNQGKKMITELAMRGPEFGKVFSLLQTHLKKIDEMASIIDRAGTMRGQRKEPFVIYLTGPPGQGKSFLSTVLPPLLAGTNADTPNLAYSRNPGIDHWDGYTGQFAVVYDDFGSTRNSNAKPGEYAEMLSIVSNEQYRLPMANLNEKGDVFRSKLVICTSNDAFPKPNTLNTHAALWRRRHAMWKVYASVERGIDRPYKYLRDDGKTVDPLILPKDNSHLRFQKFVHPSLADSPLEEPVGYIEFLRSIREDFVTHSMEQQVAAARHDEMITEALNEAREVEKQGLHDEDFRSTVESVSSDDEEDNIFDCRSLSDYARSLTESPMTVVSESASVSFFNRLKTVFSDVEVSSVVTNWFATVLCGTLGALITIAVYMYFSNRKEKSPIEVFNEKYSMNVAQWEDWERLSSEEQEAQLKSSLDKVQWKARMKFVKLKMEHPEWANECLKLWIENWKKEPCFDQEFFERLTEFIPEAIPILMERESAYAGVVARPSPIVVRAEGVYSGVVSAAVKPVIVRAEASRDANATEVITHCVYPNLVTVKYRDATLYGVFVTGRILLTNYHLFCDIEGNFQKEGVITVEADGLKFQENLNLLRFRRLGSCDAVLYEMSSNCRSFKSIDRHFVSENDMNGKSVFDATFVTFQDQVRTLWIIRPERIVERMAYWTGVGKAPLGVDETKRLYIHKGWKYAMDSQRGMCGSVIVSAEPGHARKIMGIHVAGLPGMGIAIPITCEMLQDAIKTFQPQIQGPLLYPKTDVEPEIQSARIIPKGNFSCIGVLKRAVHISTKTKIEPSFIQGRLFAPITAPAVLSPSDPRLTVRVSPLLQGISKYGDVAPCVDEWKINYITKHLTEIFNQWPATLGKRVCTEEEAINGVPGNNFAEPIDMDTSAGFPYVWDKPKGCRMKGKRFLFDGEVPNVRIVNEKLRENLDDREARAKEGRRVVSSWIDTLKDERRTLEKVALGKTRVFTIGPVDLTILIRKYFLAFAVHFYEHRLKYFSAVGINPDSSEWTLLYRRLRELNSVGFSGDYSGWDGHLPPSIMSGICDMINAWYDDGAENALVRRVIFDEFIHTQQLAVNLIYYTHIGNPSGNALTVIVNTIGGAYCTRYVWLTVAPLPMQSLTYFEENVRETIYGDDLDLVASPEVVSFFTPQAMTEVLANLNIVFTSADKHGASLMQNIDELTFLKRGFKRATRDWILPTMSVDTIQELTNWVRKSDFETNEEMTLNNCNESLAFAFGHGFKYFSELRNGILRVCPSFGGKLNDYRFYFMRMYNDMNVELMDTTVCCEVEKQSNNMQRIDNAKGITSFSQRAPAQADGSYGQATASKSLAVEAIGDPEWSLPDMTKRKVWVRTDPWLTSQTFQTVIYTLECPTDIIVSYLQSAPFERFTYWNGTMRFTIHVNGTRFHAGRLIAFFVPFTKKGDIAAWHATHMPAAWSVPNVFVDASSSNEAILDVPFYNVNSFISVNGANNLYQDYVGTLCLQVLSPLAAASGTTASIDVTLWVEFGEDSSFKIPINSAATGLSMWRHPIRLERQCVEEESAEVERQSGLVGSLISSVIGGGEGSGGITGSFSKLFEKALPKNISFDKIAKFATSAVASGMVMDKPAITVNPLAVYRRPFQNISSTVGPETVNRLDLDPSTQNMCEPAHFGTNRDEMQMSTLLHHPTYVESLTWLAASTPGTVITSRFIGPMSSFFQPGLQTQIPLNFATVLTPTLWEWNTSAFHHWRGGVRLRIDVIATQMHTGRLFLAINYATPPSLTSTLRDQTSQYGVEIDLNNECRTFLFDIPQNSRTTWMRVCKGPIVTALEQSTDWFQNYFYGSYTLSVLNQLVAPDNVPADVSIIISTCGSPGGNGIDPFEVYYPTQCNSIFQPLLTTGYVDSVEVVKQSEEEEEVYRSTVELERQSTREAQSGGLDMQAAPAIGGEQSVDTKHPVEDKSGDDAAGVPTASDQNKTELISPIGYSMKYPTGHFGATAPTRHVGEFLKRYVPLPIGNRDGYLNFEVPGIAVTPTGYFWQVRSGWTWLNPIATGAANMTRNGICFAFVPVQPVMINDSADVNGTIDRVIGGRMPLNFYGSQYRFWRGSMNYKAIFTPDTTYTDNTGNNSQIDWLTMGAVFVPGVPNLGQDSASPNWSAMATLYANCNSYETIGGYGDVTSSVTGRSVNQCSVLPLAVDVATAGATYIDVQVPFTSHRNVHVIPVGMNNNQRNWSADCQFPGHVLFFVRFRAWFTDNGATWEGSPGLRFPLYLYQAAGDDMRLGALLGPPRVRCMTAFNPGVRVSTTTNPGELMSNGYDTWLITLPMESKKKEEAKVNPNYKWIGNKWVHVNDIPQEVEAQGARISYDLGWRVSYSEARRIIADYIAKVASGQIRARAAMNEILQKCWTGAQIDYRFWQNGTAHAPNWHAILIVIGVHGVIQLQGVGMSQDKGDARELACNEYLQALMTWLNERC